MTAFPTILAKTEAPSAEQVIAAVETALREVAEAYTERDASLWGGGVNLSLDKLKRQVGLALLADCSDECEIFEALRKMHGFHTTPEDAVTYADEAWDAVRAVVIRAELEWHEWEKRQ